MMSTGIILVKITNKGDDLIRNEAVINFMIHEPCDTANASSPCMVKGKCSKFVPKQCPFEIVLNGNGFVVYRRREVIDKSCVTMINGVELDNKFVVVYNVDLVVKY
ncbi:Uncharacterized protein TCM_002519 [Theobroma cacao]|uniref:Uncharacterized protein n=1 Tax=Theobroma cacao TaxID=3641 RepID=A0A061DLF9_THECC|nr:Uncharacterized protein TCM_002519 [Theobroma cacao]